MDWSAPPRIVAHRGASREAPENTMAAFRAGLAHTPAFELDVHLASDGVPVVVHDGELGRTVRGSGRVGALTSKELRAKDAGSWFRADFAAERVPTLEEVLSTLGPRALVDVEAKTLSGPYPGLVEKVGRLALRLGLRDRVLFTSFDADAVHEFKVRFPEMRAGVIVPYELDAADVRELAPYSDALALAHDRVTDEVVAAARSQGLVLLAWTVDEPSLARELWKRGVDSVVTNDPAALVPHA